MNFDLEKAFKILERTPAVVGALLQGLSLEWTASNEGEQTWSAYEVVGHLVHAEKTDWIPRMDTILANKEDKTLPSFDRQAHLGQNPEKSLSQLLEEFRTLQAGSITYLLSNQLTSKDLSKSGIHPAFGYVTLSQVLSTWVVHDLNHIAQIFRVMAMQYKEAVGPWIEYLKILRN
jgi:uncharacterized damage-inducible protein DinB